MKTATLNPSGPRKTAFRIASILVPIDFSKASIKALSYAAALAERFDGKLTLMYVIEPVNVLDFAGAFPLIMEDGELAATCKSRLTKLARKNSIRAGLIENALIRRGRPHHEITEAARTLKVDIIVIATNGYSGLNRAIMGSVTERVVRNAPCPVLVVREHEHEFIDA